MSAFAHLVRISIASIAIAGVCLPAGAQAAAGVGRLSWLAGCWSAEKGEAGSGEQWMQPAAGTMLATARTVKNGKVADYEFMRIHEGAEGRLLFTAIPSGQKEATFTELRSSESEIVFENATHDFPQRVIYRRIGDARVLASIEGMRKGALRVVEFPLVRSKCEA
ncbi:MAG: DUF6265 family protein [Pseudomonadota bacterium]